MTDLGEFDLIARIAHRLVGAGDDAAVLELAGCRVVLAVDALVEGRHFRRDLSSMADVGWKAVAANVSDLAAMGPVRPRAALVALLRPPELPAEDVEALYDGMAEAAAEWGLDLVGGDTCGAGELSVSVTVLGELEGEPVWRSGARPGDRVVVVGALGRAAAALAEVAAGVDPDPVLLGAHRRPRALLEAARVLAGHGATALIDVSDGLGRDLGHVCRASGVKARVVWSALPATARAPAAAARAGSDPVALVCGGGEDYALLATLPAGQAELAVAEAARLEGVPAAVVGEVVESDTSGPVVGLILDNGTVRDIGALGWDHFAAGQEET